MQDPDRSPVATGKLREHVDSGQTGDKVANPDPAAAPLETGAEAAGTPTPRQEESRDLDRQRRIAAATDPGTVTSAARPQPGQSRSLPALAAVALLAVLVVAGFATALLTLPG